jgi:copper chaperone
VPDRARGLIPSIPPWGIITEPRSEGGAYGDKDLLGPGMQCGHCEAAVGRGLEGVSGVETIDVDLATERVTVSGEALDDAVLIAAIDEAGHDGRLVAD